MSPYSTSNLLFIGSTSYFYTTVVSRHNLWTSLYLELTVISRQSAALASMNLLPLHYLASCLPLSLGWLVSSASPISFEASPLSSPKFLLRVLWHRVHPSTRLLLRFACEDKNFILATRDVFPNRFLVYFIYLASNNYGLFYMSGPSYKRLCSWRLSILCVGVFH